MEQTQYLAVLALCYPEVKPKLSSAALSSRSNEQEAEVRQLEEDVKSLC